MAKLSYTKLNSPSRGRYDLMVDAKVKELIDWYEISMLLTFAAEWEEWAVGISDTNAFSFRNAYRFKIENGVGQIWRQFSGSDKDPILVYEIKEVGNG
jgi:hypothetical protein